MKSIFVEFDSCCFDVDVISSGERERQWLGELPARKWFNVKIIIVIVIMYVFLKFDYC